jgi:ribosomal protein S18 acetylase RimI-like enzyme
MSLSFLKEDLWLSEVLKRETFRLELGDDSWVSELKKHKGKNVFIFAKVPVTEVAQVQALQSYGFNLVDTNISFTLAKKGYKSHPGSAKIRPAIEEDESFIAEIAASSFSFSRFHLDPQFKTEEANKVKKGWVQNFFRGNRGNEMFVAEEKGVVVGFLLLINQGKGSWLIDLIGVHKDMKGKRVGGSLIDYAMTHCKSLSTMNVGTQLANLASIKMYERMGFKFEKASYVFHYHGESSHDYSK